MKYRPEIDGLRAVAVSSVIFYHADISVKNISFFTGGFIGVDIFFVISGYLITSILMREMQSEKFSLLDFYERRARRILPALFFVLLASIPFAFLLMLPKAFDEFTLGLLSTLGFGSNIFFWLQDSYTAVTNAFNPLLHTWSLAVEEQFYLFFPLLLLTVWRWNTKWIAPLIFTVFVASLLLAEAINFKYADAAFYLLPTRAWELMAGAILAWSEFSGKYSPKPLSQKFLPTLGMALIAGPLLLFNDTMPHPGLLTLMPIAGTMMVMRYASAGEWTTWILSTKLFVFVGLISYSFYLWHQPVFVFARIQSSIPITDPEKIGLMAISFALAAFSWWFVERPFRNKAKIKARTIWVCAAAFSAFLALLCVIQISFGVQQRFVKVSPIAAEAADLKYTEYLYKNAPCHGFDEPYCTRGPVDANERWVALGDSHMDRVAPVLWDKLKTRSANLTLMISGGCGYAPGMEVILDGKPDACTPAINRQRQEYLLSLPPSKIVVLGRYTLYLEGTWFDNGEGGVEDTGTMYMQPAGEDNLSRDARIQRVQQGINEGIEQLVNAGHEVILIYPVPEMGWDIPKRFNRMTKGMEKADIDAWMAQGAVTIGHDVFKTRNRKTYEMFGRLSDYPNVLSVYPEHLFCDQQLEGKCSAAVGGDLVYSDDDHLSKAGAEILVDEILSIVK